MCPQGAWTEENAQGGPSGRNNTTPQGSSVMQRGQQPQENSNGWGAEQGAWSAHCTWGPVLSGPFSGIN